MIRALKQVVLLLLLIGAAYAGFRWGPAVFPTVERVLGIERSAETADADPTPALADSTLDRFERFRRGEGGDRLVLGGRELSSVVRYSLPGILPPGVTEPTVRLESGEVTVSARVVTEALRSLPRLGEVTALLPDTVDMEIRGSLVPFDQTHLALMVDRVEASRIPIPRRLVGELLEALGSRRAPTLPTDAIQVPLPDGLQSVFVQRDSLVLVAEPRGGA